MCVFKVVPKSSCENTRKNYFVGSQIVGKGICLGLSPPEGEDLGDIDHHLPILLLLTGE